MIEKAKPIKADVLIRGLDNDTPKEAALDMGKYEVGNFLAFHQKKMQHWRNRGCLLKLFIHRKHTKVFKGFSEGVFKEIIKYA